MEDDTNERRPKRQKRESSYKAKAFEKFKQLKNGTRNKYDIDDVENVYDIVDEKEYTKRVLGRQDDDWIVDDDGSGYVEDGREIFDDDLDHESIAAASTSKNKGVKRKKKVVDISKGKIQSFVANMPVKKKEEPKLDDDAALSELLQEIKETPTGVHDTSKQLLDDCTDFCLMESGPSPFSTIQDEKRCVNKFLSSMKKPNVVINPNKKRVLCQTQSKEENELLNVVEKSTINESVTEVSKTIFEDSNLNVVDEVTETTFEDSNVNAVDDSIINENDGNVNAESKSISSNVEVHPEVSYSEETIEPNDLWDNKEPDMLKDWVAAEAEPEPDINLENSDIPLIDVDDKKVFRFFWWDAYEDAFKQPGVVFLFGKTYFQPSKSYISCCLAVRNIERRLFFLPRVAHKNSDKPVTTQDLYNEINESVMKKLQVKTFKSRPISKKFAFDPTVPMDSDYVEVRYSAKEPSVSKDLEGDTFSKVFGTETSYLEILLLDRKIKGPCWLDVTNPSVVTNPVSWCKLEVNCNGLNDINVAKDATGKPPLVVASINMQHTINSMSRQPEIVMLSCVTNIAYAVDKPAPTNKFFQKHFCVFTNPDQLVLPFDLHSKISNFKATTLQKMQSEKALLNYFISQFSALDCDLVVGHDLQGFQINILCERIAQHKISTFSKLGRIKRSVLHRPKLEKELFLGRLVCDIKLSAKELIKCRTYDLDTLCQEVLKLESGTRMDLEPDEVYKLFQNSDDILRLVGLTMQDTAFILRIMYTLNIIPLALQITNIAGNVMSRTLMGGRSERNEFLLLHAFYEKDYIVPDKYFTKNKNEKSAKKKPTYSGGLVLDPKVGFYDKLILLMDFNSLYPSIIQEYNICFTTMPPELTEDNMVLPDRNLPPGILPTEIRKLVESRREVKKLMNNPDLPSDLKMQYHIRQMALKLTANSMYGCLGFSNSRFYAKNLAALITYKGREILTNTKEVVQKMNYDVIYGDTDSLMINTNNTDFEQVLQVGVRIKQEINKMYRQVELDVDGVFKFLLLLKKKKYAAVTLSKEKNGELKSEIEYKGLDIVRRDWSRLASEAGKCILNEILSDQSSDDRFNNILQYLNQLSLKLKAGTVPLSLLVITKQLTKNPDLYADAAGQPHVQVALRYNQCSGGHFRSGDTVSYVICDDGSDKAPTQRAYHIEELKNNSKLAIDVNYYLSQQIFPVIQRLCEPIEELDIYQIADCLGLDHTKLKVRRKEVSVFDGENFTKTEVKFRDVERFFFICYTCKAENAVDGVFRDNTLVLERCENLQCGVRPADYVSNLHNQLLESMYLYFEKFFLYDMYCEDPMCEFETKSMPMAFFRRSPICPSCKKAFLLKRYTQADLHSQICFFRHIFDLTKIQKKPILDVQVEKAYGILRSSAENVLSLLEYNFICLHSLFTVFGKIETDKEPPQTTLYDFPVSYEDESDFDDDF